MCASAALVRPVLRYVRSCVLRTPRCSSSIWPEVWRLIGLRSVRPSLRRGGHGFSRPGLAEPDIIGVANLTGDDLVAGGVHGALKRHSFRLLLGSLGFPGREILLVELGLD